MMTISRYGMMVFFVLLLFVEASCEQKCNLNKPSEILSGLLKERHQPLITAANQKYDDWKVSGVDGAKLTKSSEASLWRDAVGKLSWPKGRADRSISITPPFPVQIPQSCNRVTLWIFGPRFNSAKIQIGLRDSKGRDFVVPLVGCGSQWANKPWWSMAHGIVGKDMTFPVHLTSIGFDGVDSEADSLCFDSLAFYCYTPKPLPKGPDLPALPFPTTDDTILPTCLSENYHNDVAFEDETYRFRYRGDDGTVVYCYRPKTGTLGDITVRYNDTFEFAPADGGGILAKIGAVDFSPGDSACDVTLLSKKLDKGNRQLTTQWCWSKAGKRLIFDLTLGIKGKSLVVEVRCQKPVVRAFRFGRSQNTPDPKLLGVPFFHSRWSEPKILYTNGVFISGLVDWYRSHASYLLDSDDDYLCLRGNKIHSATSATYMGGTSYEPKTNSQRNPLYERIFITVSPKLLEVLPNIPNPPSTFGAVTSQKLYSTRAYPIIEPADLEKELSMWRMLHAYGVTDIFVRYHAEMWRTPIQAQNFTVSPKASQEIGGDEAVRKLVQGLKALGYLAGPYVNYRMIHPLNPLFDDDMAALTSSGQFMPRFFGNFELKPTRISEVQRKYAEDMVRQFGWNAVYSDETTNTPPWGLVDFDNSVPGAGKFTEVFYRYGQQLLEERRLYNGPVWSEGTCQYLWAGLTDVSYAQNNRPDSPTLVDFQLHKTHVLANNTGVDLTELYKKDLDWKLATQIVYGNMGHLWAPKGQFYQVSRAQQKTYLYLPAVLKSYFMMRQLQPYYAMVPPVLIRYNNKGSLVSTEQAIATGAYKASQVYVKYKSGLEVYVNRNQAEPWTIQREDSKYVLPPNGYMAFHKDGFKEYSCQVDGHRVDYVTGTMYTYCDGRGKRTDFGNIVAANSYFVRKNNNTIEIIPTPFKSAETIYLRGLGRVTKITPYNQAGKPLSVPVTYELSDGVLNLSIRNDVFKYVVAIKSE